MMLRLNQALIWSFLAGEMVFRPLTLGFISEKKLQMGMGLGIEQHRQMRR